MRLSQKASAITRRSVHRHWMASQAVCLPSSHSNSKTLTITHAGACIQSLRAFHCIDKKAKLIIVGRFQPIFQVHVVCRSSCLSIYDLNYKCHVAEREAKRRAKAATFTSVYYSNAIWIIIFQIFSPRQYAIPENISLPNRFSSHPLQEEWTCKNVQRSTAKFE